MAGEIYPEPKDISVDILKPAVSSFFKALTDSQWANLKSDSTDSMTNCQLVELLCEVAELYTSTILYNLQAKHLTLEDVAARLGHTVPESFAEVLGVREEVPSYSSEVFNNLIVSHVFDKIRFFCHSNPDNHTEANLQQISDFHKMISMVSQGVVMIRELIIARDEYQQGSSVKERIPLEAWDYTGTNLHCVDTEHIASREIALTDSRINRILDGGQAEQGKFLSSVQTKEKSKQKPKKKGIMRNIKKFFSKYILKGSIPPPRPVVENTAAENLPKVTQEVFGTHRKSNINADVGEWDEWVGSVKSLEDDGNGECIQVKDYSPQKQFMSLTYIEDVLSDDDVSETRPEENETQQRFTDVPPVKDMPEVETSVDGSVETFRLDKNSELIHLKPYNPSPLLTEMSSPEDVVQDELLDDLAMEESEDKIPEIPLGEPQKFCLESGQFIVAEGNFMGKFEVELPLPSSYTTPVEVFVPKRTPFKVSAPEEGLTSEQGPDVHTSYVKLLVGTLMTQAIKESNLIVPLEICQLIEKRLFDKIFAALGYRDIRAFPKSMSKLKGKIFNILCKKLLCPEGVLLSVMALNSPGTEDVIVSCFLKAIRRAQIGIGKRAFRCVRGAVRKFIKSWILLESE